MDSMYYTVGNEQSYTEAIREQGTIYKSPGGYAFKTREIAQRFIDADVSRIHWIVWGILIDWENDTTPSSEGDYHLINKGAEIVDLRQAGDDVSTDT